MWTVAFSAAAAMAAWIVAYPGWAQLLPGLDTGAEFETHKLVSDALAAAGTIRTDSAAQAPMHVERSALLDKVPSLCTGLRRQPIGWNTSGYVIFYCPGSVIVPENRSNARRRRRVRAACPPGRSARCRSPRRVPRTGSHRHWWPFRPGFAALRPSPRR